MFANYKNEKLPLDDWILKKFELLLECQLQLNQSLKRKFLIENFYFVFF